MVTSEQKSALPSECSDEQQKAHPANIDVSAVDGTSPTESKVVEKNSRPHPAGARVDRTESSTDGNAVLQFAATDECAPSWSDLRSFLRQFHQGMETADDLLPTPDQRLLPAAMHPYRNVPTVRHDFPLVLLSPTPEDADRYAAPLAEVLPELIEKLCSGGDEFQMLRDNTARLELAIHTKLESAITPFDLSECVRQAAEELEEKLALRSDGAKQLHHELEKLIDTLPPEAVLVELTERTPLDLMLHVVRQRAAQRFKTLTADAGNLASRLRDLIRADDVKTETGRAPAALAEAVGEQGASRLRADRLAEVLGPTRGLGTMSPVKRARIEETVDILRRFSTQSELPRPIVVSQSEMVAKENLKDIDWHNAESEDLCVCTARIFDDSAARHSKIFSALRIARLELTQQYDPARHEALCEAFDWRSFTQDELLALPPIIALESAEDLVRGGVHDLCGQLLSGRAVQTIVIVRAAANPGQSEGDDPLQGCRFELGYLGISHREAVVSQSSAARPSHLIEGYIQGLRSGRAALHVVASGLTVGDERPSLGAWMHTSAGLEGRAHPLFHYDPDAGQSWARRLTFEANPQLDADWSTYQLCYRDETGKVSEETVPFTFADYVLLEPAYRDHFRCLPTGVTGDELIGVGDYLALPPDEAINFIPYIWAAGPDGQLHRQVITQQLAFACRDRLNYWHTLQELAGIGNEYVREAVDLEREQLTEEFNTLRREQDELHAAELERVRSESATAAFQQLARALLDTNITGLASSLIHPTQSASAPPTTLPTEVIADEPVVEAPAVASEETTVVNEDEDDEGFDEPWIESALCTSCNDCTELNPQLFVYNANKQATIGDSNAGTFAELVKAAELCPARCIHPGKPLNPSEPNLDELIERARKYN